MGTNTYDLTSDEANQNAKRLYATGRKLIRDLVEIRNDRDLSQSAIADAIGINRSGVCRFENEESDPRLETILRYAHAIGAAVSISVSKAGPRESLTGETPIARTWHMAVREADRSTSTAHGQLAAFSSSSRQLTRW